MALSECCVRIDSHGQELIDHGSGAFPVAYYHDDFRVMNVPWHWHPEWEAVYIIDGSCTVAVGQEKRLLSAGEGFFVNSGALHGCWDLEESGCIFHSLVFHPRFISGGPDSAIHLNYVLPLMESRSLVWLSLSPALSWQQEALEAIELAWTACFEASAGYELVVRASLSRLIFLLWAHMPPAITQAEKRSGPGSLRIKTMLSFIHDNYGNDLTVSSIAAAASVSESECLRCFRNTIGITPIQYLKQYRLQRLLYLDLAEFFGKIKPGVLTL